MAGDGPGPRSPNLSVQRNRGLARHSRSLRSVIRSFESIGVHAIRLPPPLDSPNLAGPCQIHEDEPWNDEVRDRPDGGRDPPRAREFWAPKKDGLSSVLSLRDRGGNGEKKHSRREDEKWVREESKDDTQDPEDEWHREQAIRESREIANMTAPHGDHRRLPGRPIDAPRAVAVLERRHDGLRHVVHPKLHRLDRCGDCEVFAQRPPPKRPEIEAIEVFPSNRPSPAPEEVVSIAEEDVESGCIPRGANRRP